MDRSPCVHAQHFSTTMERPKGNVYATLRVRRVQLFYDVLGAVPAWDCVADLAALKDEGLPFLEIKVLQALHTTFHITAVRISAGAFVDGAWRDEVIGYLPGRASAASRLGHTTFWLPGPCWRTTGRGNW